MFPVVIKSIRALFFCSLPGAVFFSATLCAQTISADSTPTLPEGSGVITASYPADSLIAKGGHRLYLIQDIHADFTAQKNLAAILRKLISEEKFSLVMVEGGFGDMNLHELQESTPLNTRDEVALKYLKSGMFSGEEYLQVTSDYKIDLWGIEDKALYKKHYLKYLEVEAFRDDVSAQLGLIKVECSAALDAVMNASLANFEKQRAAFAQGTLDLLSYADYLLSLAQSSRVSEQSHENLNMLQQIVAAEKKLPMEAVQAEQDRLMRSIQAASAESQASLQQLVSDLSNNRIDRADFSGALLKLAEANGQDLSAYEHLVDYRAFLEARASINVQLLIKEISQLEDALRSALIQTDDERLLLDVKAQIESALKLVMLKWRPEDYEAYLNDEEDWAVSLWVATIRKSMERSGKLLHWEADPVLLDQELHTAVEFYELAKERDISMTDAVLEQLTKSPDSDAALIVGGFHTESMAKRLSKEGINVTVITPFAGDSDNEQAYAQLLEQKNTGLLYEDDE